MKIKNIRKNKKLTQDNIAVLTGIPVRTIRAYEQGTRKLDNANISHAVKIAHVLNCKLEDILEDAENIEKLKCIYK